MSEQINQADVNAQCRTFCVPGNVDRAGVVGCADSATVLEPEWLTLCRPLTQAFEQCRLTAYPDPATGAAPWTIGWGATGAGIASGVVWTQAEADARLNADLIDRGAIVDRLVSTVLTSCQKAAVVDFVFNEGAGNFSSSTLRNYLNTGDFAAASNEFREWDLANGKVMSGLIRRRTAERSLFLADTL